MDKESKRNDILTFHYGGVIKYTPAACQAVIDVASQGGHVAAMILAAGARSKTTYYEWQKKYPEFREACEYGKLLSQEYLERIGMQGMQGEIKNFNATTWVMLMNNKFPEDYSRTGSPTGNTTINFNTLNLTETQKMDRINGLLQKLGSAGITVGSSDNEEETTDSKPED